MAGRDDTPRDLLFGLLALQNGLIDQDQLVTAFSSWTRAKGKTLAEILVERGSIDPETRSLLAAMAAKHLKIHGGDTEKSLASLGAGPSTRQKLMALGDTDLTASMSVVGLNLASQDATVTMTVGTSTSGSQRFRVLRPHAQGGLGAVFVALDGELNREVALKQILDHHADDPVSRTRFLIEAEITGGLEHPGIVPVYGLGHYGDGRPYYAMRFIRGDSLKDAIAGFHSDESLKQDPGKRSLALRKLLRRFVDVCNAIDYAHGRGVLHRDLKPGNVIVGRHGETLVIDWGLAKPMGHAEIGLSSDERTLMPLSSPGSAETLPGSAIGTPAYMSPEQAVGDLEHLGPRSDVYSLGATLYCLLTGKAPFEGRDLGIVLRDVQKGAFPKPRQVDPTIDPALEAVCLTAMATSPHDRYANARVLAEDVERWSADEPVSAWREPLSRRARRWARRNRTAVAAGLVGVLAAVVGLAAVLIVQTQAKADLAVSLARETKANEALAIANGELGRSRSAVQARYELAVEAVRTFHTGVSEDFLLKQDQFKELRDRLLKSASDFYGKLGALLGKETDAGSRRALAASEFEVAELTEQVGRNEAALASHRKVLASREAIAGGTTEGSDRLEAVAEVGWSLTAVANLLARAGKTDEALATYRRAEGLLEASTSVTDPPASIRAALASCLVGLGSLLEATGHPQEALAILRRARGDQQALASSAGATNKIRDDLGATITRIGNLLSATGKPAEAEAEYRAALANQRKLADDNPTVAGFRERLASGHGNLGNILSTTGRLADAEPEYREAMAILRKLAKDSPAVTEFRKSLAINHGNLGLLLSRTGRPADAATEYREAMAIWKKLADDNPAVNEFRDKLAISHSNFGRLISTTGRPSEVEAEYREAMTIWKKLADDNPAVIGFRSRLAISHNSLAILFYSTGRPADAEAEYRQAMVIQRKLAQDNPAVTEFRDRLAISHGNLGVLLINAGRPADAEAEYREALRLHGKLVRDNPAVAGFRDRQASNHHNFADLLSSEGRSADAEAEYREAMTIWRKLAVDNPAATDYQGHLAHSHHNLGHLLARTGRPADAEPEYREALAIQGKLAQDNPAVAEFRSRLAMSHDSLGSLQARTGRTTEAVESYVKALTIQEKLADERPETTEYQVGAATTSINLGTQLVLADDLAGGLARCRRALEFLGRVPEPEPASRYSMARAHALIGAILGRLPDESRAGPGDTPIAHLDESMALIAQAIAGGYRDLGNIQTDKAFDPIRSRPNFRLLIMDLAFPARPFADGFTGK